MDDLLNNISKCKVMSSIDCWRGYFQVPMQPDSVERTAFITPFGLYEFLVTPFGLTAAPATFQRLVNQALHEYVGDFCFVYLDDILIFSQSTEDHLRHVHLVFEALRSIGLRINGFKSKFWQTSLTWLGFKITSDGLKPDNRLVETINSRSPPTTKKEAQSFLGMAGFFRRFVFNYSSIAAPITSITGKNVPFVWGPEQQSAFEELKKRLTSAPVLRRADHSKQFTVWCDSSTKAIASILTQDDEDTGKPYVIGYHSRKLTATQQRWTITELECYAVVDAVTRHWSDFLLGAAVPFRIITDHVALKYLMTCKTLTSSKLARWALLLQQYMPFTIEHRPGTLMAPVDCLSRPPAEALGSSSQQQDTKQGDPDQHQRQQLQAQQEQLEALLSLYAAQPLHTQVPDEIYFKTEREPNDAARAEQDDAPHPSTPSNITATNHQPIRIAIEGNIGCGKSSVLTALTPHLDKTGWHLLPEPLEEWQHLLPSIYNPIGDQQDLHDYAATLLQLTVLQAYANKTSDKTQADKIIMERSPWSSLKVFLPAQNLPYPLHNTVQKVAHLLHNQLQPATPTAIIYLETPSSSCHQRIIQRGRQGEQTITEDYLQSLQDRYEQELQQFDGPVVTINAEQPIDIVTAEVLEAIHSLTNTLQQQADINAAADSTHTPTALVPEQDHTTSQETAPPQLEDISTVCDIHKQIPVLYQSGPGKFQYSQQFIDMYQQHHGHPPDDIHRVDHLPALKILATLGYQASSAPGSNIRVALVPIEARNAIKIDKSCDGGEHINIDCRKYALVTYAAAVLEDPHWLQDNPWIYYFTYDASVLQKQITYPTLESPTQETSLAQLNMLEDDSPPPTPHHKKRQKSSPTIDRNLRCEVCEEPDDWSIMLICDGCSKGYHTYCIDLTDVPSGDWFCEGCAIRQKTKSTHQPPKRRPFPTISSEEEQHKASTSEDDSQEDLSSEDLEEDEFGPLFKDIWEDEAALYYIKTGSHDSSRLPLNPYLRRREIKRIEKRAGSYRWDAASSTLFKNPSGRHKAARPCPPISDRANIIRELHSELGHVGSARLTTIINTRYWWPGISNQTQAVVKACPDCIRNRALFRHEVPLQPIPLPDGLFERVHLDSAGPYPTSRNGNKYIYLAVCATSKYPIAMAAPKLSAADFAAFFMLHVVAQHGVPAVVVHDSGPEFGEPWSTCLHELGVEQRRSSAYHPNTNGQAESLVKQILHSLQRMINESGSPDTWDERLPMALLGLRTAPNSSTKHSPAFVVYGRHLCLPAQRRRLPAAQQTNRWQNIRPSALESSRQHEDPKRRPSRRAAAGAAAATAAVVALNSSQEQETSQQAKPSDFKHRTVKHIKLEDLPNPTLVKTNKHPPPIITISSDDDPKDVDPKGTTSEDSLEEGTKALMRRREVQHLEIQQQLRRNVKASQEKMKRDHSRRKHSTRPSTTMPPNSLVLMKAPSSSKLTKGVEGPFLLVRYNTGKDLSAAGPSDCAGPETRALLQDGASKRWWVSVTRITPFSTQQ